MIEFRFFFRKKNNCFDFPIEKGWTCPILMLYVNQLPVIFVDF